MGFLWKRTHALHILRCYAGVPEIAGRKGIARQQHTTKRSPLSRIDVRMIEGKPTEILLEMDSYRLQSFARSLGAESATSIPAGTGRRSAFQVYIFICLLVSVRGSYYSCIIRLRRTPLCLSSEY